MKKILTVLSLIIVFSPGCSNKTTKGPLIIKMNHGKDLIPQNTTQNQKNRYIGYMLYDLSEKKVIESFNSRKTFIPASTQKVITTIGALDILGKNYKFKTILAKTGFIRDGILHGDLIIKGYGDPLFSMNNLMIFVTALKKVGIKEIEGSIIYDQSHLPFIQRLNPDMDNDLSYNTSVSALSLDFNSIWAHWLVRRRKNQYSLTLTPSHEGNRNVIDHKKRKDYITYSYNKRNGRETWSLNKAVKKYYGSKRIPVKDPGRHSAFMLQKLCNITGIKTSNKIKAGVMPSSAQIISTHKSPSVLSMSGALITYSNNMMAELLALSTAKKLTGKNLNQKDAMSAIVNHYKKKIPSISWKGINLINGSGLTSKTRLTPEQLTGFLIYADNHYYGRRSYRDLLTPGGWGWSMKKRLYTPEVAFKVWSKTGTINYSLGLSGYLFGKSGKEYAFTIFVTDYKKRFDFEKVPQNRDPKVLKKVNKWIKVTKKNMDTLVMKWISTY